MRLLESKMRRLLNFSEKDLPDTRHSDSEQQMKKFALNVDADW